MRVLTCIMAVLFVMSSSAQAKDGCYSNIEAEAEQGIRIHSELMVIGLNCQHMGARENMNLYGTYRDFTIKHANLFANYEKAMLSFFGQRGDKKPEKSLNDLRTGFANKISNDAASMRPDIFCAKYAERIEKASDMEHMDVRKWAATFFPSHPVSYPLCEG